MAEIILPPEENEETPQTPELNIDKPTENSKVITIEFEAKKTNKVSTKDTNQQLYTTDTDAWFEFKETSLEGANGTYSVVFRNRHDGSIFQRTGDVVGGVAYYKIPHQEIRHAGAWRGQIVYTLSNGDTTAREFGYDVKGHILDGKDVREIVVEDFETLMSQLRSMKDNAEVELAGLVNTTSQNETDRQAFFVDLVDDIDELQANYQELLDTGVLQTNINTKLEALEEEYAPKLAEVTAQLAQTGEALQPFPLRNVKLKSAQNIPKVMDIFGGYVWGVLGSTIYRRTESEKSNWVIYTENGMNGLRMLPTNDNEVLLLRSNGVYKSKNFYEPDKLTWTLKHQVITGANYLQWGIDGDGQKFIAAPYAGDGNWSSSRQVIISTDMGESFNVVYDTLDFYGESRNNNTHLHAVAYDRWADRFYFSEGHGVESAGIHVSTDDGATWVLPEGLKQNSAPTTLTATPSGLVCGSDYKINGLYGVARMDDPMDEEIVLTWEWKSEKNGLIGFAQRGFYDERTKMTYVSFQSGFPEIKPVIAAGTINSGGLVYEWDSGGVTNRDGVRNLVVTSSGELIGFAEAGDNKYEVTGKTQNPGSSGIKDEGNVLTGSAEWNTSTVIGSGVSTNKQNTILIGTGSKMSGVQNSVGIGVDSDVGNFSIALGNNAKTGAEESIAIGRDSKSNDRSVALGNLSNSSGNSSVALGTSATSLVEGVSVGDGSAAGATGVSIGKDTISGLRSVAIGFNAKAENSNSVAIGRNVSTNLDNQFAIGSKHLLINNYVSTNIIGSLPEKTGALFVREISGKMQLCVKLSDSSTIHVLAES